MDPLGVPEGGCEGVCDSWDLGWFAVRAVTTHAIFVVEVFTEPDAFGILGGDFFSDFEAAVPLGEGGFPSGVCSRAMGLRKGGEGFTGADFFDNVSFVFPEGEGAGEGHAEVVKVTLDDFPDPFLVVWFFRVSEGEDELFSDFGMGVCKDFPEFGEESPAFVDFYGGGADAVIRVLQGALENLRGEAVSFEGPKGMETA